MKQAGQSGADIGANVLHRYQNGALTTQPLWEPRPPANSLAALSSAGVNDVAGESCVDVHKRLNVQTNGCTLPSSSKNTNGGVYRTTKFAYPGK